MEPKPCPFCGSDRITSEPRRCATCGASGPIWGRLDWNTRAAEPEPEPLPCPWCGGQAKVDREPQIRGDAVLDRYYVVCDNKDCFAAGPLRPTRAEALAAWNEVASKA